MKALIWDLDGTLIHFKINFIKARRTAMEILKENGIPKEEITIKKSILENVKNAIKIFEQKGFDPERINNIVKKIDSEVSKIEYDAALKATKIDGIEKVLEFADQHDLKQAIYTYNTRKNAITSLKTVELLDYFSFIAGRDNVENPKPHQDHLLYICEQLEVKPEEVIVIGDTYRDIQGALNLGAKSIAIKTKTSGFSNKDVFEQADIIVPQDAIPGELIVAINQLL